MTPKSTSARLNMLASTGRRMDISDSFIVSAPRHWSGNLMILQYSYPSYSSYSSFWRPRNRQQVAQASLPYGQTSPRIQPATPQPPAMHYIHEPSHQRCLKNSRVASRP